MKEEAPDCLNCELKDSFSRGRGRKTKNDVSGQNGPGKSKGVTRVSRGDRERSRGGECGNLLFG